jgi:hypothetical protein
LSSLDSKIEKRFKGRGTPLILSFDRLIPILNKNTNIEKLVAGATTLIIS